MVSYLHTPDGLYYKNMVTNDASKVVSELWHNLEHHVQSSITLLESSIMLLEVWIMFLQNITYDDHHMMIVMLL